MEKHRRPIRKNNSPLRKNNRPVGKNRLLNEYDDPQKLAAWAIASHLEASPQRTPKSDGSPK